MIKTYRKIDTDKKHYYICIGASAGGLESIQLFFDALSMELGMTYFIIQHHSPDHESVLDQILSRDTSLPVKLVEDGMMIKENRIYIIPSGYLISIYHGRIYFIQKRSNVFELPIDYFFESLAIDKRESVIGIIFSGTGNDGSLGMQSIKENGGTLIVQSEESSQFFDMPHNTMKATSVDYVLAPKDMPLKILEIIEKKKNNYNEEHISLLEHFSVDLMKICYIILHFTGVDFSHFKEKIVAKRVKTRMNLLNMNHLKDYIELINKDLNEKTKLFNSLTMDSEEFFLNQDVYDALEEKVLPILNYRKKTIRVWSVGCSTGQEVYSLAIAFLEYLEKNNIDAELKFFATNFNETSLNIARKGTYKKKELHQMSDYFIEKYFVTIEKGYRIIKEIREMIVFAKHDLLNDSPFSNLDLINCRDVLINYNKTVQYSILNSFQYALDKDGILIIGKRESLGEMQNAFSSIDESLRIFSSKASQSKNVNRNLAPNESDVSNSNNKKKMPIKEEKIQLISKELIEEFLEAYDSSGVLIDSNYKILQIFNDVYPYLRISKGQFSDDIFTNISSDLATVLKKMLRALESKDLQVINHEITQMSHYNDFILRIDKVYLEGEALFLISFRTFDHASSDKDGIISNISENDLNH